MRHAYDAEDVPQDADKQYDAMVSGDAPDTAMRVLGQDIRPSDAPRVDAWEGANEAYGEFYFTPEDDEDTALSFFDPDAWYEKHQLPKR